MSKSYLSWLGVALVMAGVAIVTGHPAWGTLTGAVLALVGAGVVVGTGRSRSGVGDEPRGKRVSNNLVTLSSAAIIAVYAAGFHRTRAAADEFEAQAARRRARPRPAAALLHQPIQAQVIQPPAAAPEPALLASEAKPLVPITAPSTPADPPLTAKRDKPQHSLTETQSAALAPDLKTNLKPDPKPAPTAATAQNSLVSLKAAPAPSAQASQQAHQRTQLAMSAPAAPVAPVVPAAATAPAVPAAPAPTPAASTPATIVPAAVPGQVPAPYDPATRPNPAVAEGALTMPKLLYKDGTFLGWGRSAHGNIQAQVIVQNGRISSTAIARCETAYSCDWIAKLPTQVVSTQDPQTIDIVTGASDSSYAFQDAVTAALFKAQRGE